MICRPCCMVWLAAALIGLAGPAFAHGDMRSSPSSAVPDSHQTDWGMAGMPARVDRTIEIRMTDEMRFSPERLTVRRGETIRFVVRNSGRKLHEMVIGTPAAIAEHAILMKKFPKMEHADAWMAHVKPRQHGELIWHFNRAGLFEFACLVGSHFERGMRGTLEVTP